MDHTISMGHVQCSKCGHCCQNVAVKVSPTKLKESYYNWRYTKKHKNGKKKNFYTDVWLLYPMLIYKGYDTNVKKHRYFCKHLKKLKNKSEYLCTIYKDRPEMCSSFGKEEVKKGYLMDESNKKLYPKCSLC